MRLNPTQPLLYPITAGAAGTEGQEAEDFHGVLEIVAAAVDARIDLLQIREKQLDARRLSHLVKSAANLTCGSPTQILVNDRADVALAAGTDGVHLATRSMDAGIIRRAFPPEFLIGASAHSVYEAKKARDGGADFATFGPVFDTFSKRQYGPPLGIEQLTRAVGELAPFPLIALGGITRENVLSVIKAGAAGVAGIRLFADPDKIAATVRFIRNAA